MEAEPSAPQAEEKKSKSSSRSLGGIMLRIFLVLISGGVIGAVVYFSAAGWVPYLEQRIFEPIRVNQDQLQELEATQNALGEQVEDLGENQGENQLIYHQDLEATITAAEGRINQLEAAVATLSASNLTQVPALISTLSAGQQANQDHISALATAQMEYLLARPEDDLLKINALLTRASQYLLHANYGLMEEELLIAQQILLEMAEQGSQSQLAQTLELLTLIEGILEDLPDQPALASAKLELAWQLTLRGFGPNSGPGTPTPTPTETPTPTPTPN